MITILFLFLSTALFANTPGITKFNEYLDELDLKVLLSFNRSAKNFNKHYGENVLRDLPPKFLKSFSYRLFLQLHNIDRFGEKKQISILRKYYHFLFEFSQPLNVLLASNDFIDVELQSFGEYDHSFNLESHNFNVEWSIQQRISNTSPNVIFVDLDDTVFHYKYRISQLLNDYIETNEINNINLKNWRELPILKYTDYLYEILHKSNYDFDDISNLAKDMQNFFWSQEVMKRRYVKEKAIRIVLNILHQLEGQGVQIVYLTRRSESMRGLNQKSLDLINAPDGKLIMHSKNDLSHTPHYKVQKIKEFLNQAPEYNLIGLLDDKRSILSHFHDNFPKALPIKVLPLSLSKNEDALLYILRNDHLKYNLKVAEVLGANLHCQSLLL